MELAHIRALAGRPDAVDAAAEALEMYESKGNAAAAARARDVVAASHA
jgi:hypothetical protein